MTPPPRYNSEYGYNAVNHALLHGEPIPCYNPYYQYYQMLMAKHAEQKRRRRQRKVVFLFSIAAFVGVVLGTMLGALW